MYKTIQLGGSIFGYLPLGLENTILFKIFDWIHNAGEAVVDEVRKKENLNKYSPFDAGVNVLSKKKDFQKWKKYLHI